ncbi:MAG: sigma-70 family RNA polymerase sigma factor [Planctomycetes bacterium]|nr:sigma-70 family RNA polymerase sigma factor [Planctomycetota bacterium]
MAANERDGLESNRHDDDSLQLVYDELRAVARQLLRGERKNHTLQPTALVHEAWLRLTASGVEFGDEAVFRRLAIRTMRRALVDHARRRTASKRGAHVRVTLDLDEIAADKAFSDPIDVLAMDDALERVAEKDERLARILELRVFAGYSLKEIGDAMGVSLSHAQRLVTSAIELLREELEAP